MNHTALGIVLGAAFVVGILGVVAGFVSLSIYLKLDNDDLSIGTFGAIAILFVGALISIKVFGP